MTRQTVRLTLDCNNECVFCAQAGLTADGGADIPTGTGDVTFVGGEPLLYPGLDEAITAAKRAGRHRIGVQTNGRGLAARARELAAAGLTDVHVSIHGADAPVHDYHTGVAGSFQALVDGVAASRAAGLCVVATTVLTRSNFRVIGKLPWLLKGRGVAAWTIAVPRAVGRAAAAFDRVMPRLGLALPFALHAIDAARKLDLPAWIAGAPVCALGPFAARAVAGPPRAHPEPCADCAARSGCPGVDPVYAARFGGDELSARVEPAPEASDYPVLRAMFVGAGELALPDADAVVPEPPRAARLRLPVLGKGRPGAQEAPKSTPRKTGEALREVFPELFDKVRE